MFLRAWDECVELQCSSKEDWAGRVLSSLQQLQRHEVFVHNDTEVVGGLILAEDPWDLHVGPCLSVFAQYVLPEYRMQGISPSLMRTALRIAKQTGARVLAYTHRQGPWRYLTTYRRIK